MKLQSENKVENSKEKHPVFTEKQFAKIRMKLQEFAEIEFLYHHTNLKIYAK